MKGLIVFNEQASISFFTVDREFEEYVRLKLLELGASPLVDQLEDHCDLEQILLIFFLPFVNSVTALKKPLISVTGEDDLLIVFNQEQFDKHVFMAVNGDGTETEEMMMRKLHVLNRILGLLYGPVIKRMMPSVLQQRQIEWQRLDSLLKSYEKLYSEEQCFLVEAMERVDFGHKAQDACASLIEECLLPQKNGGITGVRHALLLTGTKVSAVCGHSPQLPTPDILLIILIIANRFYHKHLFPRLFSKDTTTPDTDISLSDSFSVDDEYLSCLSDEVLLNEEVKITERTDDKSDCGNDLSEDRGETKASAKDTNEDDMSNYFEQKVFLKLKEGEFIPHILHCIEVYPQIVLVLVAERIGSDLAGLICQSLSKLHEIFNSQQTMSVSIQGMFDMLDDSIRRIIEGGKVEAWNMKSLHVVQKVSSIWDRLKQYEVVEALNLLPTTDDLQMGRVVTEGKNLLINLTALFEELYFSSRLHGAYLSANLTKAIAEMIQKLVHIFAPGKSELDYGRELFNTLDDSVSTVVIIGNAEVKRLKNSELKQNIEKMFQIWGRLKEYGTMMATSVTEDLRLTKVVSEGRNLLDHLTSFFREQLYDVKLVVPQLIRLSSQLIGNYSDHLIKAPISPVIEVYPGMVHFLFVNRDSHVLKAPSTLGMYNSTYVELLAQKCGKRPGDFLREKTMVLRAQNYLTLGHQSHTWLDTEFRYGYFLMLLDLDFEDFTTHQLQLWKSETHPPGVLSGDYYSTNIKYDASLMKPTGLCELYCIFKPEISIHIMTNICKIMTLQLLSKTVDH